MTFPWLQSIEQSNRPSGVGTSAFGYDASTGERTSDGDDYGSDGKNIGQHHQSKHPSSSFICEDNFMHCTQDEYHDSRRVGSGVRAIGKLYRGKHWRMTPYNENSF